MDGLRTGQLLNALGAVCVVVYEHAACDLLLLVDAEPRNAELDEVVDELLGCVVGDALPRVVALEAPYFEACLAFHGIGKSQGGQCRRSD